MVIDRVCMFNKHCFQSCVIDYLKYFDKYNSGNHRAGFNSAYLNAGHACVSAEYLHRYVPKSHFLKYRILKYLNR